MPWLCYPAVQTGQIWPMSSRPKRADWFTGAGQIDLSFISLYRALFHPLLLPITSITVIKTSTTVWRVISFSCRTPALPLAIASATPPADYSGSHSRSTTSSGTLKSFWWAQMGSRWWGGTPASACPLSVMTSEDTFLEETLMKHSIRLNSYSVLAACKHKVSSFWPTTVAC